MSASNLAKQKTFWLDNNVVLLAMALIMALFILKLEMDLPVKFIIAIGVIPLAIAAIFRYPALVVIAFASFSFFRLHEAYPVIIPLHPIFITAISSFVIIAWHLFIARTLKPYWSKNLSLMVAFFLTVTFTMLFSINFGLSLILWQEFVKIIIMIPIISWLIRSESDLKWANRIFIISGTLIAIRAIYNKLNGIGLVEGTRVTISDAQYENLASSLHDPNAPPVSLLFNYVKMGNVLGDPNDLALILLFPLGFAMALLIYRTGFFSKILAMAGVVAISWGIIATQSRGGLLGMMAVFAVIAANKIKSRTAVVIIGVLLFIALFAAMGIGNRESGGFANMSAGGGIDESSHIRLWAWMAAINIAIHKPFTGVGLANFPDGFIQYAPVSLGRGYTAHSTWFLVLGEVGIIGLILFLAMVITTFKMAVHDFRRINNSNSSGLLKASALGQIAGLASFCVSGSFLSQGFTWPIYILAGLTAVIHQFSANIKPGPACNGSCAG